MAAVHDIDSEWTDPENDALAARLQGLSWSTAAPDVRDRCWERIRSKLDQLPDPAADQPLRGVGQRYDFSRRQVPCRETVSQALSRRPHLRALSIRPALSLS